MFLCKTPLFDLTSQCGQIGMTFAGIALFVIIIFVLLQIVLLLFADPMRKGDHVRNIVLGFFFGAVCYVIAFGLSNPIFTTTEVLSKLFK